MFEIKITELPFPKEILELEQEKKILKKNILSMQKYLKKQLKKGISSSQLNVTLNTLEQTKLKVKEVTKLIEKLELQHEKKIFDMLNQFQSI